MRFLLSLVLLFATSVVAEPPKSFVQQAHAATLHTHQSTVTGGALCSATAIAPHALLTASHCELPDDDLEIEEGGIDTKILGRLRDNLDHTIYLVAADFKDYAFIEQHDSLEQGENVFLFGNPGNWHDQFRRGYVTGLYSRSSLFSSGPDEILFDLPVFHGDSGSGVFNEQGRLVAVITGHETQNGNSAQDFIRLPFSFRLHFTEAQIAQALSFAPQK